MMMRWMPWDFPTNWRPKQWLLFETPTRLENGMYHVECVGLTQAALSADVRSWLPVPAPSTGRSAGYNAAAALELYRDVRYKAIDRMMARAFKEWTREHNIQGPAIGGKHWQLEESSLYALSKRIVSVWND